MVLCEGLISNESISMFIPQMPAAFRLSQGLFVLGLQSFAGVQPEDPISSCHIFHILFIMANVSYFLKIPKLRRQ